MVRSILLQPAFVLVLGTTTLLGCPGGCPTSNTD